MDKEEKHAGELLVLGTASRVTASKAAPIVEFTLGFDPLQLIDA